MYIILYMSSNSLELEKTKKNKSNEIVKPFNLIMQKAKKSGNWIIYKKELDEIKRIQYKLKDAILPFGREEFNDSTILNIVIDDNVNEMSNIIFELLKIRNFFAKLKDSPDGIARYGINTMNFFDPITQLSSDGVKRYQIRTYLKFGAKITHSKYVGFLDNTYNLAKKTCDLNIEIGSMWIDETNNIYGINIYITNIIVK